MSWSHPKLIIPIHDIALLLQRRNFFSNHGKVLVCLPNYVEGMTIDNSKNNPQSVTYESGFEITFPCLSEEILHHLPGLPSHVEPQLP